MIRILSISVPVSVNAGMRLVVGLLVTAVWGLSSGFELPNEQLFKFMERSLAEVRAEMVSSRELPRPLLNLSDVGLDVSLSSGRAWQRGPAGISLVSVAQGVTDGQYTFLKARVALGPVDVRYDSLQFVFFGFRLVGNLSLTLQASEMMVTTQVYRNGLSSCQVDVSLTQPSGVFLFDFWTTSGPLRLALSALQYLILASIVPYNYIQYFVFPDITADLVPVFESAASKIACT